LTRPPPKKDFWREARHNFKDGSGLVTTVGVRLSNRQRENFTIPSPVQEGVVYNEEMVCHPRLPCHHILTTLQELHAESIKFGVLTNSSTMMTMKTRQSMPESKVRLILNLKRKEIEVRFPSLVRVARTRLYDDYPWFRPEYRFCVSLDQDLSIAQVHDPDRRISFVLRLNTPPPYSQKQHSEVHGSHVTEAPRWLENDVWLRQTMIADPQHEVDYDTTPISLAGSEGAINIGRWTAFCITFDETARDVDKFGDMTNALRDFNVKVATVIGFKHILPEPPVWEFLDRDLRPHAVVAAPHVRKVSLLEEFASLTLPFPVRYLLDVCISTGRLNEYVVREDFLQALVRAGEFKACNRLKLILDLPQNKELADPMSIFNDRKFRPILRKQPKTPDNCALIYSATVTATTIIFHAPSMEITNRIIRQYKQHSDRFLRVRFEDDKYKGNSKIYATTTNKMDAIFQRAKRTLASGIKIGDRKYEFLAWGNSQLREHGAYFFADLPNILTASQIRAVMGTFDHEKIIAKRAARMGQCFSTTKPVKLRIPRVTRTSLIDDVVRNGYTFTDGVGQISPLLADLINNQLKLDDQTPSLFQFRLGGCKGVLAVSEDLKGIDIRLRNSQFKFPSESNDLEIIRCSKFEGAHLNRQLILVLSALGVDDSVFLEMQDREMKELEAAMHHDASAQAKLKTAVDANGSTLELAEMVERGFRASNDPFVTSLLHLWRAWSLKYLKEKAKLHVGNGATLLGCVDETKTLRGHYNHNQPQSNARYEERLKSLPQIFVQLETSESKERRSKQKREGEVPDLPVYEVKKGICLVARNPSLHEGDIRVVMAVDVQGLSHLRDVVVFPQTGDRDLPNMCSGGDLDGDDYLVIWAEDPHSRRPRFDLLPSIWNAEPMGYASPEPLRAEGDITQNDIIGFFDQYMRNDFLGRIAHAHLGWADDHDEGLRSDQCLELANLHSQAVDYPKTGRPAKLPRALDRFEWPHFMEKKGGKEYHSRKVLGRLYDKVDRVRFVPNYRGQFDTRILNALQPSQEVCDEVEELKREYDASVRRIMAQHEIKTEFEVWSTFVLDHSKASPDFKFHEEIGNISKSLKEEFEEAIVEAAGGRTLDQLQPYAVAAYQLVRKEVSEALEEVDNGEREEVPEQMPFMSFPWVLQETLGRLATAVSQTAKNETCRQKSDTEYDGRQGAKRASGKRQHIRSDLQGELFADPFQPATVFADHNAKEAIIEPSHSRLSKLVPDEVNLPPQATPVLPTAEQMSFSTSAVSPTVRSISDTQSDSTARRDDKSLLDDDEDFGFNPKVLEGKILVPPQVANQQRDEIGHIVGSTPTQLTSKSDPPVHTSKESSSPPSQVINMALPNGEVSSDLQLNKPGKTPIMQRSGLSSASAELESLNFGHKSYVDADGIYRSKFRRSSIQPGSPSSRRSSRQVSSEGSSTTVVKSPELGGKNSNFITLPSPPEQSPALDERQLGRTPKTTLRPVGTTLSAKATFRKEIDSDDDAEVMVYGDPARMAL
jgi:RNA-dependent RNA polymerase